MSSPFLRSVMSCTIPAFATRPRRRRKAFGIPDGSFYRSVVHHDPMIDYAGFPAIRRVGELAYGGNAVATAS